MFEVLRYTLQCLTFYQQWHPTIKQQKPPVRWLNEKLREITKLQINNYESDQKNTFTSYVRTG